ncbi:MAG TPA: hypothetical protein VLI04_02325, partial [Nocardioidaceae bacterium]|nr:hypothetical protein [Nocardioidaceae bacterium]
YLELRIPARFDATPCQGGELGLPANAADGAETGTPGFVARFWILDVAGTRVVVAPFCVACEAGSAQSMHQRVQSITFNQAVGTTP